MLYSLCFFSLCDLFIPPLCLSVCVWTQLAFKTSGGVRSSWCFFCFISLWNGEVNITNRLQRPSVFVYVCVAGQSVTHICIMSICGSYAGQPPRTNRRSHTYGVPDRQLFPATRVVASWLFPSQSRRPVFCPAALSTLSFLCLWCCGPQKMARSLSSETSQPPSTPILCLISSQSFSSPPEVELKIRQSPCLWLYKDRLTGLLCHFRQMKIEKSVIIPRSAVFFHIQIHPDETLHSSTQEFEMM